MQEICCCSVAQSCPALCDLMEYTPGFCVLHHLPELAQTHVPLVGDAIQLSHPLSSSAPVLNLSQHPGSFLMSQLLASGGQSIGASASILPMNIQCWFPLELTESPRDFQESSPTPQFESINSSALSFLHSPTLTSIKLVMPSSHLILSFPSPLALQHQSLFQWVNSSHEVAKVLEFQL